MSDDYDEQVDRMLEALREVPRDLWPRVLCMVVFVAVADMPAGPEATAAEMLKITDWISGWAQRLTIDRNQPPSGYDDR